MHKISKHVLKPCYIRIHKLLDSSHIMFIHVHFIWFCRLVEWGLLAWVVNNFGRSVHSGRGRRLVQRGPNQKRSIWLCWIHENFEAWCERSWRQMIALKSSQIFEQNHRKTIQLFENFPIKTSKNTFIICASNKKPIPPWFYYLTTTIVLLNPNSDFGFLFLRLMFFIFKIILCMQSTWKNIVF